MKSKSVSIQLSESQVKLLKRYALEHAVEVDEFLKKAFDSAAFEEFLEEASDRISIAARKNERGRGLSLSRIKDKYLSKPKAKTKLERQMIEDYQSIRYTEEDRDFLNAPAFYLGTPTKTKKANSTRPRVKKRK